MIKDNPNYGDPLPLNTPESADNSALEAAKNKKLKDYDREDANLQSIAKELHGIYKELSNLNRILSRRK